MDKDNFAYIGAVESKVRQRRGWLMVVGAIVVALALLTGWGIWQLSHKDKQSKPANAAENSGEALRKAKYEEALKELKGAMDKAQTKDDKVELYTKMAGAAASGNNMEQAVKYLEEKHKLAPETAPEDAHLLGLYYERSGNKPKAVEQYRIAIEYLGSQGDHKPHRQQTRSLEARVKALEGQ